MDERRGELNPLLVAQRELLDLVVEAVADPEPLAPAGGRLRGLGLVESVELGEVGELVADAHLRIQAAFLGHVAEAPPALDVGRLPVPADLAGIGGEDADRDPHRRRLPGAVRADEAEHLPLGDREGEIVDGDGVAVALAEANQLECGHGVP